MHLKHFHLLFMALAIVSSLAIGVWSFTVPENATNGVWLWLGVFFLALGLALVCYTVLFIRKMKKEGLFR